MKGGLNKRQWVLYNYLKANCDVWLYRRRIVQDLAAYYPCEKEILRSNAFLNCPARHLLTDDIRALNESDHIQKIIISNGGNGVKLASKEEAEKHIKAQYSTIFRQLKRARLMEKKAGLDGQLRIVMGSEREIVQAFTDSNTKGEYWRQARRAAGLSQTQAVALLREYIHIDAPMLSRLENGIFVPTDAQVAALEKVYLARHETQQNKNLVSNS